MAAIKWRPFFFAIIRIWIQLWKKNVTKGLNGRGFSSPKFIGFVNSSHLAEYLTMKCNNDSSNDDKMHSISLIPGTPPCLATCRNPSSPLPSGWLWRRRRGRAWHPAAGYRAGQLVRWGIRLFERPGDGSRATAWRTRWTGRGGARTGWRTTGLPEPETSGRWRAPWRGRGRTPPRTRWRSRCWCSRRRPSRKISSKASFCSSIDHFFFWESGWPQPITRRYLIYSEWTSHFQHAATMWQRFSQNKPFGTERPQLH